VSHGLSLIELDVQQSLTWNVAAGPVIVIGR